MTNPQIPADKETVEQFLARGGKITKCRIGQSSYRELSQGELEKNRYLRITKPENRRK